MDESAKTVNSGGKVPESASQPQTPAWLATASSEAYPPNNPQPFFTPELPATGYNSSYNQADGYQTAAPQISPWAPPEYQAEPEKYFPPMQAPTAPSASAPSPTAWNTRTPATPPTQQIPTNYQPSLGQYAAQYPPAGTSGYFPNPQGYVPHPGTQTQYTYPHPGAQPNPYPASGGYYRWPPSAPTTTTVEKPAPKKHVGRTVISLLLAFMLGAGSFAVGGRIISEFTPSTSRVNPNPPQNPVPNLPDRPNRNDTQPEAPTSNDMPVVNSYSKGIVFITGYSAGAESAGTGMILESTGKVLTNYHVVAGTDSLTVRVADTNQTYTANVLGFDPIRDVALLQLDNASGLQTITIDYNRLRIGDEVVVVGNAGGRGELVQANGEVTGLNHSLTVSSDSPWGAEENLTGMIESNANAEPGDSGGPTFNSEYEVIGITTAGSMKDSISYSIPIATALKIVETINSGVESDTVRIGPAGYLGITVVPARGNRIGRQIQDVVPNGPADKAGMTPGSTLISVNDTEIRGDTNLANVIRALKPGTEVEIIWLDPSGARHTAWVVLESSPVN